MLFRSLELMRLRVLRAEQPERFGTITVALAVGTVAEATERVHDLGRLEAGWRGEGADHGDGDRDG